MYLGPLAQLYSCIVNSIKACTLLKLGMSMDEKRIERALQAYFSPECQGGSSQMSERSEYLIEEDKFKYEEGKWIITWQQQQEWTGSRNQSIVVHEYLVAVILH